jgi:hypothetical protein
MEMKLQYAPGARALLVRVGAPRVEGRWSRDTLWVRSVDEPRYRPVVLEDPRLAVEGVVVATAAPVAFVNTHRVAPDERGADDGGIFRVALPSGAISLAVAPGPRERGWISQLLGASADGATLTVIAGNLPGCEQPDCIGYGLASLDVASGALTAVAPLPGMFA